MIDGHMHLENGPLTVEYAMKYVEAGVKAGMDTIQILDHTHRFLEFKPMYDNLKQASVYQKDWFEKKKLEPLQSYFNLIEEMKKMELPIAVRFGLEVCYAPQDKAFLRDLLAGYPYDFLIGSIHSIDGLLYDMNDMIESDLFTQIGHPDQLKIFHYEPDYDLKPTYERLAVLAKEHDVYMETNTGCHYRYLHEDVGTNQVFLEILKAHGVKIMTASDAHQPQHVGMHIAEISRQLGLD